MPKNNNTCKEVCTVQTTRNINFLRKLLWGGAWIQVGNVQYDYLFYSFFTNIYYEGVICQTYL